MRENVLGENPQLELRPAPESVGRLHERGLVDSLLFTTNRPSHTLILVLRKARPSICLILRSAAEGRASRRMRQPQDEGAVSKDGPRARAGQAAHGSRRALRAL